MQPSLTSAIVNAQVNNEGSKMAKLTMMRRPDGARDGDQRGRCWRHHFQNLDRAFDRAPKVKSRPAWRAPELTGEDNAHDPDWWIDETTTRAEYNERTRRHAAKWRDDWH